MRLIAGAVIHVRTVATYVSLTCNGLPFRTATRDFKLPAGSSHHCSCRNSVTFVTRVLRL